MSGACAFKPCQPCTQALKSSCTPVLTLLPANLVQAFHARGVPVCNVYGSTETGSFSIALPPAYAFSHAGSCGWPASPAVKVKLVNTQAGVGEICIRAPKVATRYWAGQPLQDAEGFFHTGNLAYCAPDGSYTVVGRAKDMLISGGENIYPAELENLMVAHPGVADCAVVGLPDAQWGEVVVACVVCTPGLTTTVTALQSELHDLLASQIARYKLPRRWVWLPELPQTVLGKVQKDRQRQSLTSASQFIAPA